jgi:hypothetical protein
MNAWQQAEREHLLNLHIGDAISFLLWVISLEGKPAHVDTVPVNFNSLHWILHHSTGALVDHQPEGNSDKIFRFAISEAGQKFMERYGKEYGVTEIPGIGKLPPGSEISAAPQQKKIKSVWRLDRIRQIAELNDLTRVPKVVLERLREESVTIHDGILYADSFENLMGTEYDPTLSTQ